jgi:hypothetical protein
MTAINQRERAFLEGAGQKPGLGPLTCQVCDFHSENRKLFKREGDGHTCSTGHYEDDEGQSHRAKNPYAR